MGWSLVSCHMVSWGQANSFNGVHKYQPNVLQVKLFCLYVYSMSDLNELLFYDVTSIL